jgi:hypothetical protein
MVDNDVVSDIVGSRGEYLLTRGDMGSRRVGVLRGDKPLDSPEKMPPLVK